MCLANEDHTLGLGELGALLFNFSRVRSQIIYMLVGLRRNLAGVEGEEFTAEVLARIAGIAEQEAVLTVREEIDLARLWAADGRRAEAERALTSELPAPCLRTSKGPRRHRGTSYE